jgi:diguanylate cyclase (GGDEF)-like protein
MQPNPLALSLILPTRLCSAMNSGILLIDTQMIIRDINPAAMKILNLGDKACIDQPIEEVFPQLPQLVEICQRPGNPTEEIRIEDRFIKLSITLILNEKQNNAGSLILLEDLTELRQTEENLRLAKIATEGIKTELHQYYQNLAVLNEVARTLNSSLDMEWILQNAIDKATDLTNSAICCLFLQSPQGLTFSYSHPVDVFTKDSVTSPLNIDLDRIRKIALEAFDQGSVLLTNGTAINVQPSSKPSAIFIPLKLADKKQGALVFIAPHLDSFSKNDLIFAELTAHQLSLAIENTHLAHKVQTLTQTDGLTGLYSRKHFNYLAEHEFVFSTRYRRPLSAVMLDIDHFKNVNEQYGRSNGDIILQKMARCIQASLRAVDLVARYGGEEIILLLPATDVDEACHVAERIRQQVEILEVQTGKGPLSITVSLGVTGIDLEKDQSIDDLIRRADTALQDAKTNGRNRHSIRRSS